MSYISILLYAALSTFQILLAQSYKLLFVPVLLKLWWNHSHKVIFWVGFHLSLGQIHTLSVVWHYLADVKTKYLEQNTEGLLKLPKRCFNLKNEKCFALLCSVYILETNYSTKSRKNKWIVYSAHENSDPANSFTLVWNWACT